MQKLKDIKYFELFVLSIFLVLCFVWVGKSVTSFSDFPIMDERVEALSSLGIEYSKAPIIYKTWLSVFTVFTNQLESLLHFNKVSVLTLYFLSFLLVNLKLKINLATNLLFGIFLITNPVHFEAGRSIVHFTSFVFYFSLYFTLGIQGKYKYLLVSFVMCTILTSVRPEYIMSCVSILLYLLYDYLKIRFEKGRLYFFSLFVVLFVIGSFVVLSWVNHHPVDFIDLINRSASYRSSSFGNMNENYFLTSKPGLRDIFNNINLLWGNFRFYTIQNIITAIVIIFSFNNISSIFLIFPLCIFIFLRIKNHSSNESGTKIRYFLSRTWFLFPQLIVYGLISFGSYYYSTFYSIVCTLLAAIFNFKLNKFWKVLVFICLSSLLVFPPKFPEENINRVALIGMPHAKPIKFFVEQLEKINIDSRGSMQIIAAPDDLTFYFKNKSNLKFIVINPYSYEKKRIDLPIKELSAIAVKKTELSFYQNEIDAFKKQNNKIIRSVEDEYGNILFFIDHIQL